MPSPATSGHYQTLTFLIFAVASLCLQGCLAQPNSCNGLVQKDLRYGISADRSTAVSICCHNTDFAEYSGYFESKGLFTHLDSSGVTTFYDSVCGKPLFRAPIGRSLKDWQSESREHGWPSFRSQEVFKKNIDFRAGGEMRSTCGTHLGHNIPDGSGDRYCIDLVCIAGNPLPNSTTKIKATQLSGVRTQEDNIMPAGANSTAAATFAMVTGGVVALVSLLVAQRRGRTIEEPLLLSEE